MSSTGDVQALRMPSRGGLLLRVAIALAVAVLVVVCFVLPAEFHVDPTGLGEVTGLMALSAPPPVETPANPALGAAPGGDKPARSYAVEFRSDEIKIPLKVDEELEYKVKMQPGGTLVYSWEVDKGMVYYDFHAERPEDPKNATSYGADVAGKASGSLIAPFAGIHGWFLQNQEGWPVVVTLRMSGYYELRDVPLK